MRKVLLVLLGCVMAGVLPAQAQDETVAAGSAGSEQTACIEDVRALPRGGTEELRFCARRMTVVNWIGGPEREPGAHDQGTYLLASLSLLRCDAARHCDEHRIHEDGLPLSSFRQDELLSSASFTGKVGQCDIALRWSAGQTPRPGTPGAVWTDDTTEGRTDAAVLPGLSNRSAATGRVCGRDIRIGPRDEHDAAWQYRNGGTRVSAVYPVPVPLPEPPSALH